MNKSINPPELWWPKDGLMSSLYPGGRNWYVYRKLSSGKYICVGAIKWDCNYMWIPLKEKYYKLVFFSATEVLE